jgi:alkylation response protein AidB-like acyl-CoA dehydrogenase
LYVNASDLGEKAMVHEVHMAAIALAQEADGRRDELLRTRCIPPDLFKRAGEANLFRQLLCTQLGGLGRSPAEWFNTGIEMGRWEPSFSWVVTQGAGDLATYVAAGDPEFAKAFLADQGAYTASSDNPVGALVPEGDGYRFEGRWGFCSGCQGATWLGGFGRVVEGKNVDKKSDGRWVLVPAARVRIEETWDTMGMIGTGSHSIVIESQHVPASWTFVIEKSGSTDYGPMSVAAGNGYWPIATSVAAVQLGIARRALDAVAELVKKKPDARKDRLLIENSHVQRQLMRAEAIWFASKAAVDQALREMWEAANHDRKLPPVSLMQLSSANIHASSSAINIVESVCDIVGTSIAPSRGIFGACLRDTRTIGSHIAVNPAKFELIAQMRFGLTDEGQHL